MTTNKYILKALDAYPFNLEEAMEALEYALSYNSEDISALCLMGQLYAEIFHDYSKAKEYYLQAIAIDVYRVKTYYGYLDVLIKNEDWEEARKILSFAVKIKGINKTVLYIKEAILFESTLKYKSALKSIKKAKVFAVEESTIQEIDKHQTRVDNKVAAKKNTKTK